MKSIVEMNIGEFMAVTHLYREVLERIATIKLKSEFDAQDVVSDVMEKAYKKRHQLKESDKLPSWLAVITSNHCIDILRKRKEVPVESMEYEQAPEEVHERTERIILLEKILDVLMYLEPEEYRDVLLLYYYREMKYDDIAEELEVPVGTVKSRLARGREELKKALIHEGVTAEDLMDAGALNTWPGILLS